MKYANRYEGMIMYTGIHKHILYCIIRESDKKYFPFLRRVKK